MKLHVLSEHEEKKSFKCDICDASFTEKKEHWKYMLHVHEGNICDTSFTEQGTLKRHMASIFEEKKLKATLVLPTL